MEQGRQMRRGQGGLAAAEVACGLTDEAVGQSWLAEGEVLGDVRGRRLLQTYLKQMRENERKIRNVMSQIQNKHIKYTFTFTQMICGKNNLKVPFITRHLLT